MSKIPPIIYNYMSLERFERLLSSGEWQMSNFEHSNDPRERRLKSYNNTDDIPTFSCFCNSPSNPMMWNFYGDAYRGVCLGFDTIKMSQVLGQSIDIRPLEYLTISEEGERNINNPNQSLKERLLFKREEWASEGEIRVFFTLDECKGKLARYCYNKDRSDGLGGLLKFVSQIYLGEKCVFRHFIHTLIEGRKALAKKHMRTEDKHILFYHRCTVYTTYSTSDGRIKHIERCC